MQTTRAVQEEGEGGGGGGDWISVHVCVEVVPTSRVVK